MNGRRRKSKHGQVSEECWVLTGVCLSTPTTLVMAATGTRDGGETTPDDKGHSDAVNAPESSECRNGHGAHETGMARTKQAWRARNGHGAHEMARSHSIAKRRCRGAGGAELDDRWRRSCQGSLSHRSPVFAVRQSRLGGFTPPPRLNDRDGNDRKATGDSSGNARERISLPHRGLRPTRRGCQKGR